MVDPFVAISRFLFDQALRLDSGRGEPKDPDWPAGTRLNALVRAVADPSRALLQIGDQLIDARLPTQPKLGERLTLRVVEPFPRLVFSLEVAEDQPEAQARTQVNLSSAGRILGDVVGRQSQPVGDKAMRLTQALPLPDASDSAPHADEIAQHLRQGLEKSGLFYEKHQARWVAGEYPLADLKQEPQAHRGATGNTAATAQPSPPAPGRESTVRNEALPAGVRVEGDAAAARPGSDPRASAETPLKGQLELLDGRALTVSVPAWEGREMQWQLPEREPQTEGDDSPVWSTRLAVELPRLGSVQAQLRISGSRLALFVSADSPGGVDKLSDAQHDLMQALHDARITLTQLNIGHDG